MTGQKCVCSDGPDEQCSHIDWLVEAVEAVEVIYSQMFAHFNHHYNNNYTYIFTFLYVWPVFGSFSLPRPRFVPYKTFWSMS